MDVNSLMAVTMGMAFYFIPAVLLISTFAFAVLWRRKANAQDSSALPKEAVKDPLVVSIVLILSGIGTIAFLTGQLNVGDYFSIPIDALSVLGNAFTDWEKPLAAETIALKGGVLIGLACTVVVVFSVISHYRRRLGDASANHSTESFGE